MCMNWSWGRLLFLEIHYYVCLLGGCFRLIFENTHVTFIRVLKMIVRAQCHMKCFASLESTWCTASINHRIMRISSQRKEG